MSGTENGLQLMLDTLHNWCQKWRLSVNENKTQVIHFRKCNVPETKKDFKYGDTILDKTDKYKYLGLQLHYSLGYNETVNPLITSSSRALGMLTSKFYSINGLHHDTYKKLYYTTVVPVMSYGSPIWGYKKYPKFETVQNRCMRTFLGVGKPTPIAGLYGEMGWYPPYIDHHVEVIRFWLRLHKMPDERLTKKVFITDQALKGSLSWASYASKILRHCNIQPASYNNQQYVLNTVKDTLIEEFVTKWQAELSTISRFRYYKDFKIAFGTEKYVVNTLNRKLRSVICKMRCDTLALAIELGRYRNPQIPRERRLCKYCDQEKVEDAIHVLFECSLYKEERTNFLNDVNLKEVEPIAMFNEIMTDCDVTLKTGYFLIKLLAKRAQTV